jgi:hypothetical protein
VYKIINFRKIIDDTMNILPDAVYAIFLEYVEEIQPSRTKNYKLAKILDPYGNFGYRNIKCVYIDKEIKKVFKRDFCILGCYNHKHIKDDEIDIVKNISVARLLNDMTVFKSAHTIYVSQNEVMYKDNILIRYHLFNYLNDDDKTGNITFSNSLRYLTIEILEEEDYDLNLPDSLISLTIYEYNKTYIWLPKNLKKLEIHTYQKKLYFNNFPDSLEHVTIYGPYKSDDKDNITRYEIPCNFLYYQFRKCICGLYLSHRHICDYRVTIYH